MERKQIKELVPEAMYYYTSNEYSTMKQDIILNANYAPIAEARDEETLNINGKIIEGNFSFDELSLIDCTHSRHCEFINDHQLMMLALECIRNSPRATNTIEIYDEGIMIRNRETGKVINAQPFWYKWLDTSHHKGPCWISAETLWTTTVMKEIFIGTVLEGINMTDIEGKNFFALSDDYEECRFTYDELMTEPYMPSSMVKDVLRELFVTPEMEQNWEHKYPEIAARKHDIPEGMTIEEAMKILNW